MMNLKLWKLGLIALGLGFATVGRRSTPAPLQAFNIAQISPQTAVPAQLRISTPQGQNVWIREAPNGRKVTCLEHQTVVQITQYSGDRRWAFIEARLTEQNQWETVRAWVKTQYLAKA